VQHLTGGLAEAGHDGGDRQCRQLADSLWRRSALAWPTPQSASTASGHKNEWTSASGTTSVPRPGTGPRVEARGLAALDASLATSLLGPAPIEHDRPSSSVTRLRMVTAISAGEPNRATQPLTSRKTSSKPMPSTSGVKLRAMAWKLSL
jgi:hypothetical protein